MRSLHQLEIDIFQIPYRPCRFHQERIADYYMSGRPRFEWEKLRQKHLIEGNDTIVRICSSCNLNILQDAEGCRIQLENLNTFLGILADLRPDTILAGFTFQDDLIGVDETRALHDEFQKLSEELVDVTWPVAQIFDDGEPRPTAPGTIRPYETFEWEGHDAQTFIFSNAGYTVCIGGTGILVKESLGDTLPDSFVRLWKEGASVFGETVGGRRVPFLPLEECLPAWDDSGMFVPSELRCLDMPFTELFGDILQSFVAFASVALSHNAGLKVSAL